MNEAPAWVILQRIAAKLGAITVVNGYFTNAGANVDLERGAEADNAAFPRIIIGEDRAPISAMGFTSAGVAVTSPMDIVVEGYVKADQDDAEHQAQRLKYDLTSALGLLRSTDFAGIEGAQITAFEITGDRATLRRPEGMPFVVVQVRATITHTTYFPPPA